MLILPFFDFLGKATRATGDYYDERLIPGANYIACVLESMDSTAG